MKGKKREKVTREIRAWMALEDLKHIDVARDLDLKPNSGAVTHFIDGNFTSKDMRDYFIRKGCPEELLKELDKLYKLRRAA